MILNIEASLTFFNFHGKGLQWNYELLKIATGSEIMYIPVDESPADGPFEESGAAVAGKDTVVLA